MEAIINFNASTASGSSSDQFAQQTQADFTQPGWHIELLRQYALFNDLFLNNFHHIFRPVTLSTPFVTPDGAPAQHWIENRRPCQLYSNELHLYENCFLPWVKELKSGYAEREKNMVADAENAEEMMKMERLIMVSLVDPASVVRHHFDDEQLMRFQHEYWAQTAYVSGRRIAPMRKKSVSPKNNSCMQSYEGYQRTLNSQGNYANPGDKAIPKNEVGVNFRFSPGSMTGQHYGMNMDG